MQKMNTMNEILSCGAMAIVRVDNVERAFEIAQGCYEGGINVMELSYTHSIASEIIKQLNNKYQDKMVIGAGTVLDGATARIAIMDGAKFVISPNFDKEVALICNKYQIPYMPGCSSVTEIIEAMSYGASLVKLFPISDFYGPKAISIIRGPLPNCPILVSGGVRMENINQWLENKPEVLGIGSLLTKGDVDTIRENGKLIRKLIDESRK